MKLIGSIFLLLTIVSIIGSLFSVYFIPYQYSRFEVEPEDFYSVSAFTIILSLLSFSWGKLSVDIFIHNKVTHGKLRILFTVLFIFLSIVGVLTAFSQLDRILGVFLIVTSVFTLVGMWFTSPAHNNGLHTESLRSAPRSGEAGR